MARKRDYKAEYKRRIERGLKNGLSRSQARGQETASHRILSEASIGKAYLKQMNIQPLLTNLTKLELAGKLIQLRWLKLHMKLMTKMDQSAIKCGLLPNYVAISVTRSLVQIP